jgi:hypothetical protein
MTDGIGPGRYPQGSQGRGRATAQMFAFFREYVRVAESSGAQADKTLEEARQILKLGMNPFTHTQGHDIDEEVAGS